LIDQKGILAQKNVLTFSVMFFTSIVLAYAIASGGFIAIAGLVCVPILCYFLYRIFVNPAFGVIILLVLAFSLNSLGRYVELPFGLLIDFTLLLTLLASVFYLKKEDVRILNNGMVLFVSIWFLYNVLELINPEPHSFEAWFFAVRASSLYLLLTVIIVFLVFNKEKDMEYFFFIWCLGSLLGAIYAIKQVKIGLNAAEKIWLATKGAKTHIIFGELRVFSFHSDAGQFGAIMGFTAVTATILSIRTESIKKRVFYIITAVLCFYGMIVSGTRGAVFIPLVGFIVYFVLSRNVRVLIFGSIILGSVFSVLKFTYAGEGNYQIRRLRSAVNPSNDISFQVRIKNQKKLADYLSTRPFGGGIGTVGHWGEKYSPGSFLGSMPPDSWYVLLWAETGIVGLLLYFAMLFYILIRSFFRIFRMEESFLKQKMMAIFSGVCGVVVASYGNPVLGQAPCSIYFFLCLVFLYIGPEWEAKNKNSLA
jgi:hypothetical protein